MAQVVTRPGKRAEPVDGGPSGRKRARARAHLTPACNVNRNMFHFATMRTREDRGRRILKVAVELAERGGFDAVRQREVAAQAGVALGTLYKRFASKEELLMAALELEVEKFELRLKARPLKGATTVDRLTSSTPSTTRRRSRPVSRRLPPNTSGRLRSSFYRFGSHRSLGGPRAFRTRNPSPSNSGSLPTSCCVAFWRARPPPSNAGCPPMAGPPAPKSGAPPPADALDANARTQKSQPWLRAPVKRVLFESFRLARVG
jgi:AcrR family transcriptional regulator